MNPADSVRAWRPDLPGVAEVFHAHWRDHSYPAHTHDTWTVLIVDDGVIGYDLERHDHATARDAVTVLPPRVPHDGHAVTSRGFRKRVLYLDEDVLPESLIGRAVDAPLLPDPGLRRLVSALDHALVSGDSLAAESQLSLAVDRLAWHLTGRPGPAELAPAGRVARLAREMIDADPVDGSGVNALAQILGVTTPHLVRSFSREFGIAPHRYILGRRLDLARRRLLEGEPPGLVAVNTGFYDQAHFTRHFKQLLATTPGRYQLHT